MQIPAPGVFVAEQELFDTSNNAGISSQRLFANTLHARLKSAMVLCRGRAEVEVLTVHGANDLRAAGPTDSTEQVKLGVDSPPSTRATAD